MQPFEVAYHQGVRHGILAAVHLPDSADPVPDAVLAQLAPEEGAHARALGGYRQPQFVGGRLALRAAARQLGVALPAIGADDRGAPQLPHGIVGSVSHKRTLAIALVARADGHRLGVDLEDYEPARPSIAPSVLRDEELAPLHGLPEDRRWIAILQRFSIKEAIYKALDPFVRRYVGFHEALVHVGLDGSVDARLLLPPGEGPFEVEARSAWIHGRIVSTVKIRQGPTPPASR